MQVANWLHAVAIALFRSVIRWLTVCLSPVVALVLKMSGQRLLKFAHADCAALFAWKFCQRPYQSGMERTRIWADGRAVASWERVEWSELLKLETLVICEVVVVQTSFVPDQIVT